MFDSPTADINAGLARAGSQGVNVPLRHPNANSITSGTPKQSGMASLVAELDNICSSLRATVNEQNDMIDRVYGPRPAIENKAETCATSGIIAEIEQRLVWLRTLSGTVYENQRLLAKLG